MQSHGVGSMEKGRSARGGAREVCTGACQGGSGGQRIVEFANQRRDAGLTVTQAILDAASTRMRPILMTSVATIAGAMPLMLATGAGAGSRTTIGVVVVFGVALSTLLSLFVVPAFYLLLAPHTRPPDARTHRLDEMDRQTPSVDVQGETGAR